MDISWIGTSHSSPFRTPDYILHTAHVNAGPPVASTYTARSWELKLNLLLIFVVILMLRCRNTDFTRSISRVLWLSKWRIVALEPSLLLLATAVCLVCSAVDVKDGLINDDHHGDSYFAKEHTNTESCVDEGTCRVSYI